MAERPRPGGQGAEVPEGVDHDSRSRPSTSGVSLANSASSSSGSISKWASAIVARVTASSFSPPSNASNGTNTFSHSSPSPNGTPSKRTPFLRSPAVRTRTPSPRGADLYQPSQGDRVPPQNPLAQPSDDPASTSLLSSTSTVPPLENETGPEGGPSAVTLTVPPSPRAFLGAIPRHKSSLDSEPTSTSSSSTTSSGSEQRRCFCGYYSELVSQPGKKPGRCKFCRSKAKYLNSQRSFDAAKLFGRRREKAEPRRAISEDRRSDGQTTEDTSASTSSATTAQSSFDRPSPSSRPASFFSTPPFLRRQERLEIDLPSPNLLTVPPVFPPDLPRVSSTSRDHGLRTPPPPPTSLPLSNHRMGAFQDMDNFDRPSEYHTHRMAHELPEYLAPPPRAAVLGRAHTDPTSLFENDSTRLFGQPTSPPPTYSDVLKQNRLAPPSYEEALCARVSDMRLRQTPLRSHSEERTLPTRSRRGTARPLTRSARAEEIPDIYWEQAARELDFCTCRKCQARYRQYFEEDPDPSGDALIPMETQVLMQEVLTDGIAFCNLM